ncbi:MAG: hypothetical protein JO236_12650 [Mycobacterium sp.]|uniref:hypothetical protein n=1 Tax=Mycobacterium sp. TaxID=1785 RepID=UPI001EBB0B59|nr:hypothetical protein [Mycobacterium sp.]MBW0018377.1 hypothetical protein [Mycobacterium sp.]
MDAVKRTRPWVRLCTSVLAGGGLALSAFGLVDGSDSRAQATPAPSYHWCPGDQWDPGWGNVEDWDWNRCHDWQHAGGPFGPAGWGPWGPPPPWAPPQPPRPSWAPGANLMWNPTANDWGFWNNGVWTPI